MKCRKHGPHEIVGKLIAPGLVVVEHGHGHAGHFGVLHIRSGLMLLYATNAEAIAAGALMLAGNGIDWTESAETLDLDPRVRAARLAAIKSLGMAGVYDHRSRVTEVDRSDVVPR